jgi:alpha-tubulin suppressor-like RCC1 family protein
LTSGVDAIAVGARHACARLGNTLKCWGHNTSGQVGDGSGLERNSPVSVTGLTASITQVETRYYHSCAVTSTGSAHCWGANTWAELGDGTTDKKKLSPVDVVGHTSGVAQISTGYQSTCIVTTAGAVECWPTAVTELTENIASVSAGAYHTCALSITGQVYCWGSNDKGQLGDGTTTGRSKPMPACIP